MNKLIFALILFLPTTATAQQLAGTGLTINKVMLEYDHAVILANGIVNPYGCQISSLAALPSDAALRDRFIALATTALVSGLKVEIWTDGCTQVPWGTAPRIYNLSISK